VVEDRLATCAGRQRPLGADAPVVLRERRQVQYLPPLRLVVREHQALHVRCLACQAVTVGAFGSEATCLRLPNTTPSCSPPSKPSSRVSRSTPTLPEQLQKVKLHTYMAHLESLLRHLCLAGAHESWKGQ